MKNKNKIFGIVICMAAILSLVSCGQENAKVCRELDTLFSSLFPENAPGAAVVMVKDGKIVFDKGYGLSDIETGAKVTDSTFFNICSVSKQFSSVALMLLSERGLLSLDDPVSKYFPEFEAEFFDRITLRHLLSHTSGIPDSRPRNQAQWEKYTSQNETIYSSYRDFDRLCEEEESCRYMVHLDSLAFEPGTAYEYQNPTYQLMLMIVEKVTGENFDSWMRKNVFDPAGMEKAVYFEPEREIPNMAHGYIKGEGGTWEENDYGEANFFGTKADGGLYCSPLEFVDWDYALYHDKVMNSSSRETVHTPRIPTDIPDTDYGYGWFIEHRADRPMKIYHTGDNGGFLIFEGRFPERDLFYLIFATHPEWDREGTVEIVDSVLQKYKWI
ncbi:MAG: beta-lactamase family protein [Bacteroidales bacterium]|nr:beta-lactamase family protein [Bacteroidales bacterium]